MAYYMTFDNGKKNTDFGIDIVDRPSLSIASDRVSYVEVPGRDELLTRKDGFNNRDISVSFNFHNKINLMNTLRPFITQLRSAKTFYFSDDSSIEYRIKNVVIDDLEREVRVLGKFTVKFVVDPFCYYRNISIIDAKTTGTFNNVGNYESKPHIKLTCSGTVTNQQLVVNNVTLNISTITDFIEIDSESRRVHKNGANLGDKVKGPDYPILVTGTNYVSCSTGITHVYITPRWRCF